MIVYYIEFISYDSEGYEVISESNYYITDGDAMRALDLYKTLHKSMNIQPLDTCIRMRELS
jgi:hypothetical protein